MYAGVWISAALSVFVLGVLAFIPAALFRRNDLADVIWGPGFVLSAFSGVAFGLPGGAANLGASQWLALTLVSVWALRLALHIGLRTLRHPQEDARYRAWREEWGGAWIWRSYLQVFLLQGLFLVLVNSSLLLLLASPPLGLGALSYAGAGLWVFGFFFESVGDEQLRRFKKNPENRGRLITHGLWAWSRHPNYFGEVVQWWGIALVALAAPYGYFALVSPLLITFLILRVSGIPLLEAQMKGRPGAEAYRRRVSKFFPWPPKGEGT